MKWRISVLCHKLKLKMIKNTTAWKLIDAAKHLNLLVKMSKNELKKQTFV